MGFEIDRSNLKFNVRAMSSAPTSSTHGAENDIALITTVPMTNWILSPDNPVCAPRTDGDVWITYSVEGDTFNALRDNTMAIVVLTTYQYVNDEWTKINGKIYKNGTWQDMITEVAIFENGILNTDTFGAFNAVDNVSSFYVTNGVIKFSHNNAAQSSKLFDVTAFDHIEILIDTFSHVAINMYLVDESNTRYPLAQNGKLASGTITTYDVSERRGEYYVMFQTSTKIPNNNDYTTVSSVKLKV